MSDTTLEASLDIVVSQQHEPDVSRRSQVTLRRRRWTYVHARTDAKAKNERTRETRTRVEQDRTERPKTGNADVESAVLCYAVLYGSFRCTVSRRGRKEGGERRSQRRRDSAPKHFRRP